MTHEERARFEILLEDIRTSVGVIAEGHTVLVRKIDGVADDVAVLKTDVAVLKTDVAVLKTDVAVLKTDVTVLKTDMVGVKSRLGRIEHHLGLNGAGAPSYPQRPSSTRAKRPTAKAPKTKRP
jgi:hypothetical protein